MKKQEENCTAFCDYAPVISCTFIDRNVADSVTLYLRLISALLSSFDTNL